MRYIKLFEEHNKSIEVTEEVIKYIVYVTYLHLSTDPITEEFFDEYEDALDYYSDLYEYGDGEHKTQVHTKILEKVIYEVRYEYEPEYEEKEDIHEDDKEWEIIDHEVLKDENYQINQHSHSLLDEVENWYKDEYDSKRWKYHQLNIYYNEEEYETIQVRITNHTENIHNIDRYGSSDYYLSIVISDYDVTDKRFGMSNSFERRSNEIELKYNSDTNVDEIKLDIKHEINNIKEEILLKNE